MPSHTIAGYWPKLIKNLRICLKISQSELADRLGVDQATISRWERGLTEPQYEMRRFLDEMAKGHGLAALGDIALFVQGSPFPMILVDSRRQVVAASASSGFDPGRTTHEQTPEFEQRHLQSFNDRLDAAGFWAGAVPRVDYEFPTATGVRRAIVTAVTIRGEVFALVQKAW